MMLTDKCAYGRTDRPSYRNTSKKDEDVTVSIVNEKEDKGKRYLRKNAKECCRRTTKKMSR